MEAITLVCDVCGKPAVESVRFGINGRNLVKDFCSQHLAELVKGARAPKRGRPTAIKAKKATAGTTTVKRRPGRPRKVTGTRR